MPRSEIIKNKIRWINIETPSVAEMEELRGEFDFHPLDIEDCLTKTQRSKTDAYDQYIFMVLLFPFYNKVTKEIQTAEVHFFITNNTLITVHNKNLQALANIYEDARKNINGTDGYFAKSSEYLLYNILNMLLVPIYPMLDHVSVDIDQIEKGIFSGNEKRMVEEILVTRRKITDLRKIMQSHKKTLQKLILGLKASPLFPIQQADAYYDNLVDHTKEIWDALGAFKEAIEALQETNESIISHKLNQVMKVLTLFSVTMLPATLIASLFGMNLILPFANSKYGFWIVAFLCSLSLATIFLVFTRKTRI